jgi:hypothetical protein
LARAGYLATEDESEIAPAPIWQPFAHTPQQLAYDCTADIIGFGGSAGGGKSDEGLGKAFTQFYRSIFFRREYPQLKNVIARGDEIQDGRCRYISGEKKHWSTPDGRIIELGALEHASDVQKYKGRPHDFIVFDEAADFTEYMVRFIMGWLRTDRSDVKPQALLTFNPPTTPEGEWIVKFFAPWLDSSHPNPAQSGELRWFITVDSKDIEAADSNPVTVAGDTYHPKSRTFFRATVEDNPVYMATGYDKHLESLPEPLRSQLRYGDFNITAKDDMWQCIPTAWIIEAQNRWLAQGKPDVTLRSVGVDPSRGGADDTVIAKLYGNWFEVIRHAGSDVPDGATGARYVTDIMETNAPLFIDVIGYGASVYDHLKILSGISATPVNVGSGSHNKDKTGRYEFANLRAELWWKFREALDPANGENLMLPLDAGLRLDLRSPKYQIAGGKIKVESKEDIKKRIGRSTDAADAVQLAWWGATYGLLSMPIILSW